MIGSGLSEAAICQRQRHVQLAISLFPERQVTQSERDFNPNVTALAITLRRVSEVVSPNAIQIRFFRSVNFSGSHRKSIELVAAREADVTAVDCVTLGHLQRFHTRLTSQVKVIDWTPSSPCLPFVTSAQTGEATFQALRSAMADVFTDSTLAPVRELLLLEGVNLSPDTTLSRVSELEAQAEQWRYPVLL
jgi:ABC-type phosphate/phosphonate transport system substrate-binding protein